MNILVCIKQVPCPESPFAVEPGAPRIDPASVGEWQMNRFDAHALEAALGLRESGTEARIDAVSVGPSRCAEALKRAVGMGADRAFLLGNESGIHQDDPLWVASAIAAWARTEGYDLILAGVVSEDRMQGVTGPALAVRLDLPWATAVTAFALSAGGRFVRAEREIEEGRRDVLELDLPALLTIQSGSRTPRYPSLSNLLRAGRRPPESLETTPETGPPGQTDLSLAPPRRRRQGRFLQGDPEQKAAALLALLRDRGLLKEVAS